MVNCQHCGAPQNLKGLRAHELRCGKDKADKEKDTNFRKLLKAQQRTFTTITGENCLLLICSNQGQAQYAQLEGLHISSSLDE